MQGHGDIGFEEAEAAAAIIALTGIAQRMERALAEHSGHGVRELDFATGSGFVPVEVIEDFRQQNVAADQRQVGRISDRLPLSFLTAAMP
jgi:hypothetical protein